VIQPVELSLNPDTAALEIRPRDVNPSVEVDWYAAQDNLGVADLEATAKSFFENALNTLSPFDSSTYETLLRSAVTHLDANGVYWPSQTQPEDRSLPRPEENLKVTDTWVLFARPRTNSAYIQDLERFKIESQKEERFPPAVAAILSEPETENPQIIFPAFRGVSASYHSDGANDESSPKSHQAKDLFFPKPFNDEQVRIIQLLEIFDGVVTQGPPGTGKTHTIANVICHYLANGKRVLVTSMKEPALGVLTNQLPEQIKPLAISLLTSEKEGLKQFEHSILKIASEVQNIDRQGTQKDIRHLEASIDTLHGQLARIDWEISAWAKKNLNKITIDANQIEPVDAAQEIVANQGCFDYIPDAINISNEYAPKFTDQDILALRTSRAELDADMVYLQATLPQIIEFPDSKSILQTHQDLSRLEQLKREVDAGGVPRLIDTSQSTIDSTVLLKNQVDQLRSTREGLMASEHSWVASVKKQVSDPNNQDAQTLIEQLVDDMKGSKDRRKDFLKNPVSIPIDFEKNAELVDAVQNLTEGKRPFGFSGLIGKSAEKKELETIRIVGQVPTKPEDWQHIKNYIDLQKQLRAQAIRWNTLALEVDLPRVSESPQGGLDAIDFIAMYEEILKELALEKNVLAQATIVFSTWEYVSKSTSDESVFNELDRALQHHLTKNRLANVWAQKEQFQKVLEGKSGLIVDDIKRFINQILGDSKISDSDMQVAWSSLMAELSRVLSLRSLLDSVTAVTSLIAASGAPELAKLLCQPPVGLVTDDLLPSNWKLCWKLKRLDTYLKSTDAQTALKKLSKNRSEVESTLSKNYQDVVVKRTWLKLAENASPSIRASLQAYLSAIQKIGKGTGKRAVRYRQDARNAAKSANAAVPCWVMPHYRISESLPAELGCFDLVIIDEASQSDLTALPAILRAQKVLIVGDDKQVSPEGVGLEEDKIRNLMTRFLGQQVKTYRPQMSPERSIYDLFKVVYAQSSVMLKEHFRCVGPIIEYSKREFYNHELRPLRLPKASERLDPPLIDILVQDGHRDGDKNMAEARVIVEEIKRIVSDERFAERTIGVVSLLADKQALLIWQMLTQEVGPELIERHKIACGDARTFQGKERDIMFLSMVVAPNENRITALSRDTYAQRFNVAASRARDRMYLVRSVALEHLSQADKLRRGLINHFAAPFSQDEDRQEDLRQLCESNFEREVYDALSERGYWVTPQVKVGHFRIDLVVEGGNDGRLAIECDGDQYHGPDKWSDDMHRQRILERAGWVFWRCFASTWVRNKSEMIDDLVRNLSELGIEPIAGDFASKSIHSEQHVVLAFEMNKIDVTEAGGTETVETETVETDDTEAPVAADTDVVDTQATETDADVAINDVDITETVQIDALPTNLAGDEPEQFQVLTPPKTYVTEPQTMIKLGLTVRQYAEFNEPLTGDPREVNAEWVSKGIVKIIAVEGPMVAKRAADIYLRAVGIRRMGNEIKATMIQAFKAALKRNDIECVNETDSDDFLSYTVRSFGSEMITIRTRGDRSLEEITPSEIQFVAKYIAQKYKFSSGSDEHLKALLEFFELKRLTTQSGTLILEALKKNMPYVDEAFSKHLADTH
jgi:superfamily I DNA and/or RNA helicase/very-short-patch-repair endonuclease